ncbi:MAG: flippase [Candidatus Aminicenantes bacterium]|nr:flippase [Candidatus Aminicenantes bacterium]
MENGNGVRREITAIAKGAGIFFFGTLTGNGLRYVYQLIVARSMGPGVYGGLLLGIAILQVMALIADLGLSQGVVRYTAIYQGLGDRRRIKGVILSALRAVLVSGPLLGLLLFLGSQPLAFRVFRAPELALVLKFMAVVLPLYVLTTIMAFSFQGLQVIKYRVYVNQFVEPGARVLLAVLFLALGGGLLGAMSAYVLGVFLALAAAAWLMRRVFPEISLPSVVPVFERKELFSFSWPLLFSFLMSYLIVWNDTLFLGILRSAKEVGVYGAAQRTALLMTFILGAFTAIFGPIVADLLSREKRKDLSRYFQTVVYWSFALTLPLAVLAVLFARPVLRLFGEPFAAAAPALNVLAGGWAVHALLGLCGNIITMSGRSKLQMANNIFLLAVNVALHLLLIPRYGIPGAAAATAGSVVLYDVLTLVEVRRFLRMTPFRPDLFKPLAAGGLGAGGCLALTGFLLPGAGDWISMASGSVLFLVLYGGMMLLLGIREEDKAVLGRILARLKNKKKGDSACDSRRER